MQEPGPEHILLIDDDELSRAVLELHLVAAGYRVTEADSGEAALALLRTASDTFDLILSDLQMPGLHGAALAEQLRMVPGATFALMAMSGSQPVAERYSGYDGFLLKPFTPEELAVAVRGVRHAPAGLEVTWPEETRVLDEVVFTQLESMMNLPQLSEIFGLALRELGKQLAQMQRAFAAGDVAALQASAHTMKGGFSVLGAMELRSLGALLETGNGTPADQEATLCEIPLAAERLRRMLTSRGLQVEGNRSSGQETK